MMRISVEDSKLHLAAMEAAGATACMKALVSGGGGKAFTKDQLKTGLRGVFSSLATAWHMKPEHEEEWVATLTLRLANAHTHVLQALGKKPPPAWVLRLVNDDPDAEKAHFSTPPRAASPAGAKSPAAASPAASPAASTPSVLFWIVEWDKESRVAKRAAGPIEGKKKVKWEYATKLIKTGVDSDLATAEFKNGDVHRIPGVTVRHVKNLDASGGKPTVDVPWQSEHCISHHKLHVARKPNRGTLMVLYEQGKIACSVRVALFDMLTEETPEAFEKRCSPHVGAWGHVRRRQVPAGLYPSCTLLNFFFVGESRHRSEPK